jgi:DNA uptake protein ComE-like DNA-binding protein
MHRNRMHLRILNDVCIAAILAGSAACSPNQTPEQIRQKTAQDTATLKSDTKAVVEGVKEGLSSDKKAVDLNKASKDDLTALPGIDAHKADRIIAERPYADAHQLVTRHVLSEDEYAQIRDRVIVSH